VLSPRDYDAVLRLNPDLPHEGGPDLKASFDLLRRVTRPGTPKCCACWTM